MEWRRTTWGDEISLEYGKCLRGYANISGPVRVFGTNGPVGWTDQPLTEGPGVILGRKGAYRGVHYSHAPFFVIDTAYYVAPKSPLNMRWVYYAMTFHELGKIDDGSPIPSTTRAAVYPRELLIPPLDEQAAIAAVLGSLDDKIEQNRRTSQALEKLARATFKAWFVDFEPVKTKAAGATSFPGMPPQAFAALPTRLVDSPTGPIPEGWETGTVGDIATLSKLQVNPQVCEDELFEHFSIPAYDSGQYPVVEHGGGIKSQKFLVTAGCVLLSKLNPRIPRVWLPSPPGGRRQIASTEFLVIVPNPGWSREALYCLFQQEAFRDSLAQSASGTSNSHQRIRPGDLLARQLVIPPSPIMQTFAGQAGALMTLRESLQFESSKLAGMRDYLLPRLLSGQVKINLAEDQTADALQC